VRAGSEPLLWRTVMGVADDFDVSACATHVDSWDAESRGTATWPKQCRFIHRRVRHLLCVGRMRRRHGRRGRGFNHLRRHTAARNYDNAVRLSSAPGRHPWKDDLPLWRVPSRPAADRPEPDTIRRPIGSERADARSVRQTKRCDKCLML